MLAQPPPLMPMVKRRHGWTRRSASTDSITAENAAGYAAAGSSFLVSFRATRMTSFRLAQFSMP